MLVRMLVRKKMLVTRKPLGEIKVQLVRKKFNWRDQSAVGEKKVQLARPKYSWWEKSSTGEKKVQLVRKKFSWWKISPTYISITNNELNLNIDIEYWYYMDHIEWSILNSQFTQWWLTGRILTSLQTLGTERDPPCISKIVDGTA